MATLGKIVDSLLYYYFFILNFNLEMKLQVT